MEKGTEDETRAFQMRTLECVPADQATVHSLEYEREAQYSFDWLLPF